MIVVIQCAASKRLNARYWQDSNGKKVMFVADPAGAPARAGVTYARPDDADSDGISWRRKLIDYNKNPGNNLLGLLPAWELYENNSYELLHNRFGVKKLYILSAGWGLIAADFLTPMYDITFSSSAEKYKRRTKRDVYDDLRMLPKATEEPVTFVGGKDYVELFCRLTAAVKGERTVFYNSARPPAAIGCALKRFDTSTRTNWHYECARALGGALSETHLENAVRDLPANSSGKKPANRSANKLSRSGATSKYDPLKQRLSSLSRDVKDITITFVELENMLGFQLPKSATDYRAWWANQIDTSNRSQTDAWMGAGFKVDHVTLKRPGGRVRFRRR